MKTKNRLLPFLITLAGITILVTIHEFGHFIMCKIFGVGTPVFSIGFGPRLLGIEIGQTLFQIAALPLGGYVSIDQASLALIPYWQKMVIILAGVGFNFIFALALLSWIYFSRKGQPIPIIANITPKSPAENAGLEIGDHITQINNTAIENNINKLIQIITEHPNETKNLHILRDNNTINIPINIGARFGGRAGSIGVTFEIDETKRMTFFEAIAYGLITTLAMLKETAKIFFSMFTKKKSRGKVTGPIGLINTSAETIKQGGPMFALLLSSLSLQLAFFNTLPVPIFDGGKALLYTIEAIIGKPLTPYIIGLINLITMILFFVLILYLTTRDIKNIRQRQP